MTTDEFFQFIDEFIKQKEAFDKDEIEDDWSPEVRQNWIDRCNSQH